jgi:hypothetical protein
LWLLPIFFIALIFVLLYLKFDSLRDFSVTDIFAWTIYFIGTVGVFSFLFFNHLPLARQTELIIRGKTFEIIQRNQSFLFDVSEVSEVIEYSTPRLPWSSIVKWTLKAGSKEFTISSLTISQFNFEKHFYDKIKHETSLLPTI